MTVFILALIMVVGSIPAKSDASLVRKTPFNQTTENDLSLQTHSKLNTTKSMNILLPGYS